MSELAKKENKPAVAYVTLSRNGKALYITPVHWDSETRQLVFENDVKLFGWTSNLRRMLADFDARRTDDGATKSVAMWHSEPLKAVEVLRDVKAGKSASKD